MKCVVFVPGTMGSILSTPGGEEVWPPTPIEVTFGYGRVNKLLQDDLVVGDVIREVSCFDVYKPLIDSLTTMGFKETGAGDRLVLFPYDWRRDLETLADRLAAKLDGVPAAATSIAIVAHSMGGLIARLVLETGKFSGKPWFSKINLFTSLATPHLGAPLALARILGLDTALGISRADFRKIGNDPRYPSGYQLLPAPGEAACWDTKAGSTLADLDIYDAAVEGKLGLDPAMVARAAWLHSTLATGKAPTAIRYFYFAATGHKTATRLNVAGSTKELTRTEDAGDGTVPMWSALPKSAQKQLVVGEHSKFFAEDAFNAVFFRLFGKNFPKPPTSVAGITAATLSVQSLSINKKDEIELVIAPLKPIDSVKGKVVLERTDGPDKKFATFGKALRVSYSGPPIPVLKLRLPATKTPGFYQVRFIGEPMAKKPVQFAVTDK